MSYTNYTRGVNIEYRLKKEFESKGYFVTRSAGSHGMADLVCVNATEMQLIQIKRTKKALPINFVNGMFEKDITLLSRLDVPANCSKFLYVYLDRHGYSIYKIHKDRIELITHSVEMIVK